ncbi:MAG: glycosyltransferase family A protein [Rhodobacter sp.]|nr:glycosyltransferase family A protein [Rhodobacter sp.]
MSKLVISLSSVPPRFDKTWATLQSLVAQTAPVDEIGLYIPRAYRRFPDWDGTLPAVPDGVTVRRVDNDWGPATKVLAAAQAYRGQDVDILFCDDDRLYPPDWAQKFLDAKARHPGAVIAHLGVEAHWLVPGGTAREWQPRALRRWRITDIGFQLRQVWQDLRSRVAGHAPPRTTRKTFKRSGYTDIFEGCAGVLVRPEHFDDVAFDIPPVLWSVDDIWLSGMVGRLGVPIWVEANIREPVDTEAEAFSPLYAFQFDGAGRNEANRQGVRYMRETYGIWT